MIEKTKTLERPPPVREASDSFSKTEAPAHVTQGENRWQPFLRGLPSNAISPLGGNRRALQQMQLALGNYATSRLLTPLAPADLPSLLSPGGESPVDRETGPLPETSSMLMKEPVPGFASDAAETWDEKFVIDRQWDQVGGLEIGGMLQPVIAGEAPLELVERPETTQPDEQSVETAESLPARPAGAEAVEVQPAVALREQPVSLEAALPPEVPTAEIEAVAADEILAISKISAGPLKSISAQGVEPGDMNVEAEAVQPGVPAEGEKLEPVEQVPPEEEAAATELGAETTADIERWKQKVSDATAEVKPPDLERVTSSPARLSEAGMKLNEKRRADRPNYVAEVHKKITSVPKVEEAPPPPMPDPVPEAAQLIERAITQKLPDQSLPAVKLSPGHPRLDGGRQRLPSLTPGIPVDKTEAPDLEKPDKGEKPSANPNAKKVEEGLQVKLESGLPAVAGQSITLKDEGVPQATKLAPETREKIEVTLASLLATVPNLAGQFVDTALKMAYPKEALFILKQDFLNEKKTPEEESIREELNKVADAAGIARDKLKDHVTEIQARIKNAESGASEGINAAHGDNKKETEKRGGEEQSGIRSAAQTANAEARQKQEATAGDPDPKQIEGKRDELIEKVNRNVVLGRAKFKQAGERRERELESAAGKQAWAYKITADAEVKDIRALFTDETEGRLQAKPSLDWGYKGAKETQEQADLKKWEARQATDMHMMNLERDAYSAREMIRTWADKKLGEERSWFRRILDTIRDWIAQVREQVDTWEAAQAQLTKDELAADFAKLDEVQKALASGNQEALDAATTRLTDDQKAIVQVFFASGGNAIQAVTIGLLARIQQRRVPKLVETARSKALEQDWEFLNDLGKAENPDFDAATVARQVYDAIAGIGTNEAQIYSALNCRTPTQIAAIKKRYVEHYKQDIESALKGDLSGEEEKRALRQLASDPLGADIAALYEAVGRFNTDEAAIMKVLRNKTPAEREELFKRFKEERGVDLKTYLKGGLDKEEFDRADALMAGNVAKADAIAVEDAMHGFFGADRGAVEEVYATIHEEVRQETAERGLTTAEMETELRARGQAVSAGYAEYKKDIGSREVALEEAYKGAFKGKELDLVLGLHNYEPAAIDAAKMRIETSSFWHTSDEAVTDLLRKQHERAVESVNRDKNVCLREKYEELAGKLASGEISKEEFAKQFEAKKKELDEKAAKDIDVKSKENMENLTSTYNKKYSKFAAGGMLLDIMRTTSGSDKRMAKTLMEQSGKLSPAQEIRYAVMGLGTKDEALKRALHDENGKPLSKDEIKKIEDDYRKRYGGDLKKDVLEDVSGRDDFDMQIALKGRPETPEEMLAQLAERRTWELEKGGGWFGFGAWLAGTEKEALNKSFGEAEDASKAYNLAKAKSKYANPDLEDPEVRRLKARFEQFAGYVEGDIDQYRKGVDRIADYAATAAELTVVAAGIIAGAIFTGGTGSAATIAAYAALAGGTAAASAAAGITARAAIKGGAYGWEDIATDVVVGGVDVAASVATLGASKALLATGKLARMAKGTLVRRMGAHFAAESIEGALGGLPPALASSLLSDQTWEGGNSLAAILMGTAQGTLMAAALSGGLGSLGGMKALGKKMPTPKVEPRGPEPGTLIDPHTGKPFGKEPGPLIDPTTDKPFGVGPEPKPLIDPSTGKPFGAGPEPGILIDPHTGKPFGKEPGPLIDPTTGKPFGVGPEPKPLIDPSTGKPFGTGPEPKPLPTSAANKPSAPKVIAEPEPKTLAPSRPGEPSASKGVAEPEPKTPAPAKKAPSKPGTAGAPKPAEKRKKSDTRPETVEEFLARGGKVKKIPYKAPKESAGSWEEIPDISKTRAALGSGPEAQSVEIATDARAGLTRPPRHHVFPQEHRKWFEARGMRGAQDIDRFTVPLDSSTHQAIHGGGDWRRGRTWPEEWNRKVMDVLDAREKFLGRKLTVREIYKHVDGLMRKYGIPRDFQPYKDVAPKTAAKAKPKASLPAKPAGPSAPKAVAEPEPKTPAPAKPREPPAPKTAVEPESKTLARSEPGELPSRQLEADPKLTEALPRNLRREVPVVVDPDLAGNTVRVHYDVDANGLIKNIHVRAGPLAKAVDIQLHVRTIRTMRLYSGFSGRVLNLVKRLNVFIKSYGDPPVGSRAWEAKLELDKLPRIISERTQRLSKEGLDADAIADISKEIDELHAQLRRHKQTLDEMDLDPGRGYVAAERVPASETLTTPKTGEVSAPKASPKSDEQLEPKSAVEPEAARPKNRPEPKTYDEVELPPDARHVKQLPNYQNVIVNLKGDPKISPPDFERILTNIVKQVKPKEVSALIDNLHQTVCALIRQPNKAFSIKNLGTLLRGLESKDVDTFRAARFLVERIGTTPSLALTRANRILDDVDLAQIQTIRNYHPNTPDSKVFGTLDEIAEKVKPGTDIYALVQRAGVDALGMDGSFVKSNPDLFRLQKIVNNLPDGKALDKQDIEDAIHQLNQRERRYAETDDVQKIFFEKIDVQEVKEKDGTIVKVNQLRKLFEPGGKYWPEKAIAFFKHEYHVNAVINKVVGEGTEIDLAHWERFENMIRNSDLDPNQRNAIIGTIYWQHVNYRVQANIEKSLKKKIFHKQVKATFKGEKRDKVTAIPDTVMVQNVEDVQGASGERIRRIYLRLEDLKTGEAEPTPNQKELIAAIKRNEPIKFRLPKTLLKDPHVDRVEIIITGFYKVRPGCPPEDLLTKY